MFVCATVFLRNPVLRNLVFRLFAKFAKDRQLLVEFLMLLKFFLYALSCF